MLWVRCPLPASSISRSLSALALLFLTAAASSAQDAAQDTTAPPHVSIAEGAATLEREGQSETAVAGMPFVPGDRLQTTRGRVELLFADGTALSVDEFSTIELLDRAILRLTAGRILLHVVGVNDPANAVRYQIDTPSASAITDGPGEYRVALLNGGGAPETELAVFRGYASLSTDVGSTAVRAGERTLARDLLAPSHPLPFNAARFDAFEQWVATRRDARLGTASAQYLPRDLYAYSSTFDRYGSWMHEGSYGYVWYPTVAVGWRPYHHGYWSPLPRYGWTWIGHDVWGWPTHHYGRWGFARESVVLGPWAVPGVRRGSHGRLRLASSDGARSDSTADRSSACQSRSATRGTAGSSSRGRTSGAAMLSINTRCRRPRFRARTPFVAHAKAPLDVPAGISRPRAIPRPVAVAPSQQAGGRAVPRGSGLIAPSATGANRPSATTRASAAQRAGSDGRINGQTAPQTVTPSDAPSNGTRYVPDTRTLGGRRAAALPRNGESPQAPASDAAPPATAPRWYPPVTIARPRAGAERATPDQTPPPASQPRWGPAASGPPRSADVAWSDPAQRTARRADRYSSCGAKDGTAAAASGLRRLAQALRLRALLRDAAAPPPPAAAPAPAAAPRSAPRGPVRRSTLRTSAAGFRTAGRTVVRRPRVVAARRREKPQESIVGSRESSSRSRSRQ